MQKTPKMRRKLWESCGKVVELRDGVYAAFALAARDAWGFLLSCVLGRFVEVICSLAGTCLLPCDEFYEAGGEKSLQTS